MHPTRSSLRDATVLEPPMYLTQALHRLLRHDPDGLATVDGERRRSWLELTDRVRRLAGALASAGLRPGDRVALLARNGDHYLEYLLATFWAGGVINPVNLRWTPAEIGYALVDSGTGILIIQQDFIPMLAAIRAHAGLLRTVVAIGDHAVEGAFAYEPWIAASPPLPDDTLRRGGDLAAILYTGGTTGRPKGVMLSHDNLGASAASYAASPGARPTRAFLHTAPLFHVGALSGLFTALLAGSTHVFVPSFEPGAVLAALAREQVTDVFLVPTMMRALLQHPGFSAHDLGSVERIVYGAASIDDTLLDEMIGAFPQAGFVQAYGMTELSPIATLLGPDEHRPEARARLGRPAGRATIMTEVKIVDPSGREQPPGGIGEVLVRGPNVMLGYWNLPELTAEAVRDGWMHTGDVGRMDAAGYVTIVDRLKDVIISGGENIYSAEVESALTTHEAVAQAAVIARPDPDWGEAVHAVIVLKPGFSCGSADLRAHCRGLISGYKIPKTVQIVDALPLSAAGKVLKNVLREHVARSDPNRAA